MTFAEFYQASKLARVDVDKMEDRVYSSNPRDYNRSH